jgi:acyl-CoA thioesterase-1
MIAARRSRARLPARLRARATYVTRRAADKAAAALVLLALAALPAAADTLRLVALGDSLTHGYGLPQDQGFVPQLQRWLTDQGADVEVVNMGVSGDTTAGGKARLGWALAAGADAVILEFGGNDLLRGIDPAVSRANLDAMLAELDRRDIPVLLAGLKAPLNFGARWQAEFEGMYADLARKHAAILYPSFLDGVFPDPELMQPDYIHPNERGVARIVEAIGPSVLKLLDEAQ